MRPGNAWARKRNCTLRSPEPSPVSVRPGRVSPSGMTTRTIEGMLGAYNESDATVRLVWAIFGAIPGAPSLSYYSSLEEAQMLLVPGMDEAGLAEARALAQTAEMTRVLDVIDAIDTGDVGLSVFTGIRSALTFFFGDKTKALNTDAQQGTDAALKAVVIAWLVHTLFPGPVSEKVARVRALPAGQALLTWYAAVELGLPFADDALLASGSLLTRLLDKYGGAAGKIEQIAGAGAFSEARATLEGLLTPLNDVTRTVAGHTRSIAETARTFLPPVIATAGTIAGAAATAADALPVYRFLGARLVAEAVITRGQPLPAPEPTPVAASEATPEAPATLPATGTPSAAT